MKHAITPNIIICDIYVMNNFKLGSKHSTFKTLYLKQQNKNNYKIPVIFLMPR